MRIALNVHSIVVTEGNVTVSWTDDIMPAIQAMLGEGTASLDAIMAGFDHHSYVPAAVDRADDDMLNSEPGVWFGQEDWDRQAELGGSALLEHLLQQPELFTVTVGPYCCRVFSFCLPQLYLRVGCCYRTPRRMMPV